MLQAELKVTSGKQAGNRIPLSEGKFLVGREEDCHLRPNSDLVSRHHCVFTLDEYALRVRDLGSTNGTLVNGEKIRGGVVLNPGDMVSIGKLEFEILLQDPASEDTQTQLKINSDTQVPGSAAEEVPAADESELDESLAPSAEAAPGEETSPEMPVHPQPQEVPAGQQVPQGDTQVMPPGGMPMQQPMYPGMYPQQMMPFGYPGYPGMYPQQMGYPGMPMPGMYPQQPMPGQAPPQEPQEAPQQSSEPELRLPDPSQTGARAPDAPDPNAKPEEKTAEAKHKEEAPGMAADIIQQYLKRRPGGGN